MKLLGCACYYPESTLHDRPILFRRLRFLQLATVSLITFSVEIIQAIAFFGQLKDTQPSSFYLSTTTFDLCGIKLLYHIVIGLTLISTTYYFVRFSHRWYHGPYQTDILVDLTFFYLWVVAGFTNIFPLFKGNRWACLDDAFGPKVEFLKRVLCDGYIFSTIFGWIMIIEFCISTVLYLRLWKTRNWWEKSSINVENNHSFDQTNLTEINMNDIKNLSPRERHRLVLELGPRRDSSRTIT
ncbi:1025_t:CDS:2 [Funneliformis caledonium]|uniref:1025_t:CDS:1 n=1 Tax=Funneliformis caledonium TaxID=1117310 RepID=A0A9N8VGI2_9GLOM|nr:1025_t:CDS:2 [Funneliformis caledonium]